MLAGPALAADAPKEAAAVDEAAADALLEQKTNSACAWAFPQDKKYAGMVVKIHAAYNPDGRLQMAEISPETRALAVGNADFQMLAASALASVEKCTPLRGMPAADYDKWHFMELTFEADK